MHAKFSLITQPTQSGKTFQTIAVMNDTIAQDAQFGRSLHMVYTINTLLNEVQFTARLRDMALRHQVKVVVISSNNQIPPADAGLFLHAKNYQYALALIANFPVAVVVMCNNRNRIATQMAMMHDLDRNQTVIRRAYVYYDEIHKYIDSYKRDIQPLREQIAELCDLPVVHKVLGITATPHAVFQRGTDWEHLRQEMYVAPKTDTYASLAESRHTQIEFDGHDDEPDDDDGAEPEGDDDDEGHDEAGNANAAVSYVRQVLRARPDLLAPGARVFMPGATKRKSHNAIRMAALRINPRCAVVTLNGKEKTIAYLSEERVAEAEAAAAQGTQYNIYTHLTRAKLDGADNSLTEVSDVVARLVQERGLGNRPLVFTGLLCVSVGQTLTHRGFGTFTAMVVSPAAASKHDAVYQLMGRATGQTKQWDTYTQTEVICTSDTLTIGLGMEKAAQGMMGLTHTSVSLEQYEAFLKAAGVKPKQKRRPRKAVAAPKAVAAVEAPVATVVANQPPVVGVLV